MDIHRTQQKEHSARSLWLGIAAALSFAITAAPATAQTRTAVAASAAPADAASIPSKRIPKPTTAAEASEASVPPGELRPQNPVVPQIHIPLGRNRDANKPDATPLRSGQDADGIDDGVAGCQAKTSRQARVACRERLPRDNNRPR